MTTDYDIITVGGGLAGSSLAKVMAEHGSRVLVLERETEFKDRVRGEAMSPWGVADAERIGTLDVLMSAGGHELPKLHGYLGQMQIMERDLPSTTPDGKPMLAYYHPRAQEALIAAAAKAGAEVIRGAIVTGVTPGVPPSVEFEVDGKKERLTARFVVGANGRGSPVRGWAGFDVQEDPDHLLVAGLLFAEMPLEDEAVNRVAFNMEKGEGALLFPQGGGSVRAYTVLQTSSGKRPTGTKDIEAFVADAVACGMPPEAYKAAHPEGPLATFDGADRWVDHPYEEGVVLVGDAAASSDPSWGQGLALTTRDVRVLSEELKKTDDWDAAGHAYATEHDRYFGVTRTVSTWMSDLFYTPPHS
jgi:2-polyprenyl-6-methoxyphenol hydroxylase-like FAD-dependent oxidoreductase